MKTTRKPFRRKALWAFLLMLILLGACSSGGDARPTAVPEARLTPRPPAPEADVAAYAVADDKFGPASSSPCRDRLGDGNGGPFVFFLCADPSRAEGPVDVPSAAPRELTDAPDRYKQALDALFAGPTAAETQAGFVSGFGPKTSTLAYTVDVDRGLALINLSQAFLDVEFLFVAPGHVGELVSTIGQFDEVERVAILVEGEPLCRALEEC